MSQKELTGIQIGTIADALAKAYKESKFKIMLRRKLDVDYENIKEGDDYQDRIFNLVDKFNREGNILNLIEAAIDDQKSGNQELVRLKQELFPEPASQDIFSVSGINAQSQESKNQISQLPQICNFDLTELRDNCLNECLERKAIIGFTIACDSDAFLYSLCQRLKNEFDRSNTLIKDTLSLSPKFISVKEAITKIVRYKRLLATKNVICPVRIQVFKSYEDSSHISQHFWQSLCDEIYKSSEQVKYSLIVVMTGSEDSIFPSSDSAITLEPPQFSPAHIYVWIRDIVERLDWAESIINEWQQIMMNECCDNNSLDVRYVYEHLSESLQILQQNPFVEAESFLTELKRRNQLYA